jgi:hypothetical protein
MPSFEERFSNLFSRGSAKAQQAVAAAQGKTMPPAGGNRLTNFLPFPPGTDSSVNETGMIQRGVYRIPQTLRSVVNNNSPLPVLVSAKPPGSAAARVTQANDPVRPEARGSVTESSGAGRRVRPDAGYSSSTSWDRARSRMIAARVRIRGMLGG